MAFLAFLNTIFLKVLGLLLSVVLMFTGASYSEAVIEAEDPASVKLQFSVLSDVHMETYELSRFEGFAATLQNIGAAKAKQDALVLLGDNTMNGQVTEYLMLYSLLSKYNPVSASNTLLAMGNHDINISSKNPAKAIDRHNFFLASYNGTANDKPYYSQEINGYTFIVLGDEDPHEDCSATISAEQITWLADTLGNAPAGKPVFIFLHQILAHVVSEFGGWGTVGEQSEALRAIIEQYPNVFVFNGHAHTPQKVIQNGGVTYVNLPTLLSGSHTGIGFQVEAYENNVLLRVRDYIAGEWLTPYDIPLV